MPAKKIYYYPDPHLRQTNQSIIEINEDVRELAQDLLDTMNKVSGLGLAAPQVGVNKQMFVMDCSPKRNNSRVFINPTILKTSEETETSEEGCLSFPDQFAEITRPSSCHISYSDLEGHIQEGHFEGLEARCVQHEIDHLNGILFIDHLSKLKKKNLVKKLDKQLLKDHRKSMEPKYSIRRHNEQKN